MALIQMNFMSECLMRTVTVNAVIPFDKISSLGAPKRETGPFKTLYLLHGIFGNYTDWVSGTRIRQWAEERDLAVIMPSGENHFYLDCKANGERFGAFIGKELPEKMSTLFPLSGKREDTFIGGLSMGGYGAIVNGLKYSGRFGCVAGLSSALMLDDILGDTNELARRVFGEGFYPTVFGETVEGSDRDYNALAKKVKEEGGPAPKFYLCCGLEDTLLERNRRFAGLLRELGYELTFEEGPGGHDWDFWNLYIRRILDWLPLEHKGQGVNSGHIET